MDTQALKELTMYVEAHSELREHPKTMRAARSLDVPICHLVGHLVFLWWWAQEWATDGSLAQYDNGTIADAAGWPGDPDLFVNSLVSCGGRGKAGFLIRDKDDSLLINDWKQYGGKMFTRRAQAAERTREWRERKGRDASPERHGDIGDASPNGTGARYLAADSVESAASGSKLAQKMTDLNAQVPAKTRSPLVDKLLDVYGLRALSDIGDDAAHYAMHQEAASLYRMGYRTPEAIDSLAALWREDWRGKKGGLPTGNQFLKFASEQKAKATKAAAPPKEKKTFNVVDPLSGNLIEVTG